MTSIRMAGGGQLPYVVEVSLRKDNVVELISKGLHQQVMVSFVDSEGKSVSINPFQVLIVQSFDE